MENNLDYQSSASGVSGFKQQSLDLIKSVKGTNQNNPNCIIKYTVDDVGAISAMIYGEGIVQSELCWNDGRDPKKQGTYLLRFAFQDSKKIIEAYAAKMNVPVDTVKANNEDFINWFEDISKDPNAFWDATHATCHGGFFETFETGKAALEYLGTGKVFELDPYNRVKKMNNLANRVLDKLDNMNALINGQSAEKTEQNPTIDDGRTR